MKGLVPPASSRWWLAIPILAMLAIQVASGIPYPWYFQNEATPSLESKVSMVLLSPSGKLLNVLHIPVFAALTLLWSWSLVAWSRSARRALAAAIVVSGLFAIGNELSQAWVPTRFATFGDLLLNVIGVTLGAVIQNHVLARPTAA